MDGLPPGGLHRSLGHEVAVERSGKLPKYNGATGASDMAGNAARVCGRAQRELLRYKADQAAFFFATAFLATMTSGNRTTLGTGAVPS